MPTTQSGTRDGERVRAYFQAERLLSPKIRKLRALMRDSEVVRRAGIVCFEGEMNIVLYTPGGRIILLVYDDRIELIFSDFGPGIYIFRGPGGEVLYVGKASSLRERVRAYFQAERLLSPKIRKLRALMRDLEVVVTGSEAEALILEDALIKKYRPPFNTRLRDDKRYPYIKITNERFPRITVVRRPENDGARYFGPYTSSKAMRRALKLAHKLFPIRPCNLPVGEGFALWYLLALLSLLILRAAQEDFLFPLGHGLKPRRA